jgi:hypothetical protein
MKSQDRGKHTPALIGNYCPLGCANYLQHRKGLESVIVVSEPEQPLPRSVGLFTPGVNAPSKLFHMPPQVKQSEQANSWTLKVPSLTPDESGADAPSLPASCAARPSGNANAATRKRMLTKRTLFQFISFSSCLRLGCVPDIALLRTSPPFCGEVAILTSHCYSPRLGRIDTLEQGELRPVLHAR